MKKMLHQNSNSGFTLIELIVVIVMLGILAAIVTPKFLSLSKDANVAKCHALLGNFKSASKLVYSKAVIKNVDKSCSKPNLDFVCAESEKADKTCASATDKIEICYGYPTSSSQQHLNYLFDSGIDNFVEDDISNTSKDWSFKYIKYTIPDRKEQDFVSISPTGTVQAHPDGTGCGIIYSEPTQPYGNILLEVIDTDC